MNADAARIAKQLVPGAVRRTLRDQRLLHDQHRGARFVRWNAMLLDAWLRDRVMRRVRYSVLDEAALRASRRSETVFVFGTGSSLNAITPQGWERIAEHDTFGFNAFYHQRWVRTDFHVLRGGVYGELRWKPHARQVAAAVASNPFFADTVFVMQDDYLGSFPNQVVGYGLLPRGARLFRYRTARGSGPPTRSFSEGLRHSPGTLSDVVNCAYLLGWKEIVLAGVDLYDSRYFWLRDDETVAYDPKTGTLVPGERDPRGTRYDQPHNTAATGVVEQMARWAEVLEAEGVRLSVLNPRSLLAVELPVHHLLPGAA